MTSALRAYLELFRVFLTPTAVADSFAGLVVASTRGSRDISIPPLRIAGVAATSIALYWLGMAANDIFDRVKDGRLAPHRPLPSGRVSLNGARVASVLLAALALGLGLWLDIHLPVIALIVTILAYDAGGKRVPILGNLLMGACRGGNLLLGASLIQGPAAVLRDPALLLAAALLTLYIATVTAVSELEETLAQPQRLLLVASPCAAFPLLFILLADRSNVLNWINSALLTVLLLEALWTARRLASRTDGAGRAAAGFVGKALAGIFFVDAGIVLCFGRSGPQTIKVVLTLYALFALLWLWKRSWHEHPRHRLGGP